MSRQYTSVPTPEEQAAWRATLAKPQPVAERVSLCNADGSNLCLCAAPKGHTVAANPKLWVHVCKCGHSWTMPEPTNDNERELCRVAMRGAE